MNPARIIGQLPLAGLDSGHLCLHVLHDSPLMQSAAAMVCDQLRADFEAELPMHIIWSHFQHLADEHYSREAAEVAAQSDVVIIATTCQEALPGAVARWLGSLICQQHKPDTVFCGLFLDPLDRGRNLPPVAELLGAAAELTRREWLAGCVRRKPEPAVARPTVLPAAVCSRSLYHTPLCHGING